MKIFNRTVIILESLCALGMLWCIVNIFLAPGKSPEDVLSAVDLELPAYNIENEYDNLDRESSRWDNFTYDVTFSPKESAALVKQLHDKGWKFENNRYVNRVDIDEDLTYSASVNPKLGIATLDVLIDEDYGLLYSFFCLIFLLTSIFIAAIWGTVKLVRKFLIK